MSKELRFESKKQKFAIFDIEKVSLKSTRGITLISLVITIIILIILAGIAINLSIGENGIFRRVQQAKEKYNETTVKEKLELILSEARVEKETNKNYNEELLDNMLENSGMTVNGNNVIVDNYNFEIDKENLIILQDLGKTQVKVTKQVEEYLGKNENSKYEANVLLKVESNIEIERVTIIDPDGTKLEIETDKIQLGKNMTIEFDEEYIIEIVTKDGKIYRRKIIEKTREEIRTAEELSEFRDKVNTGLTYEGKEINVLRDIDLSTVCGENLNGNKVNWKPIGNVENKFKGTFNGNYNKINNLYINSNIDDNGALFGSISQTAIIENVIMENVNIYINYESDHCYVAAIVSSCEGKINNCGVESGNITAYQILKASRYRQVTVGGVSGTCYDSGEINKCYNKANISGTCYYTNTLTDVSHYVVVGGVCGFLGGEGKILDCYNSGNITAKGYTARAGGVTGMMIDNNTEVINCYSCANEISIIGLDNICGGVVGLIRGGTMNNSWCTPKTAYACYYEKNYTPQPLGVVSEDTLKGYATTLKDKYIEDGKIKDVNGNWVDNKDEQDNIIYINNGYPILKWQMQR